MHERMSFFEILLATVLMLWALGSVLFLFRIPGVHGWLRRFNRCKPFIHWGVFSTSDPSLRSGTFEIVVIDRGRVVAEERGRIVASGFCWSWRAFFWMPQRYYASVIQNMGREFKMWLSQTPPAKQSIEFNVRVLRNYVARLHPAQPGFEREIRLMRCFQSQAAPDEHVLVLQCPSHVEHE